ncbi:MAG: hypothetical protein HKN25_10910, partial [Pyrinomonadaceae bacterium]|nr:hypothetical protein [Pyrinomonadaceae bacterium]
MEKANAAGYEYTPLEETIKDCVKWFEKHSGKGEIPVGLKRSKKLDLLKKMTKS